MVYAQMLERGFEFLQDSSKISVAQVFASNV